MYLCSLRNSVCLPRRKRPVLPLERPRQINLVGLKRLDGGACGDCKRPLSRVKQGVRVRQVGKIVAGAFQEREFGR